nr:immunoglobulin light chain junction region [Macaca mulatta]MOX78569.1 immunoglobulin light chain junction region [Macaca mulatta]MOX79232.1 immunoglobulin light chain junction region [Macaca mulatta]MOX83358.1 immunoglobulin light chain junction region [Macaca mulatta]
DYCCMVWHNNAYFF